MIKVVVIGASGKMGQVAVETVKAMPGFSVVGTVERNDDIDEVLKKTKPDMAIEFSGAQSVKQNAWAIINNSVRPVIGSSGLSRSEMDELKAACKKKKLGGVIVPNFSIGMALSTRVIEQLAPYFEDISIVEFHHTKKLDTPSGTARNTAQAVGIDESTIVSVRSDGFVAKQQVYLARAGERVIVDHETFDRAQSFGAGIQLCCKKVMKLSELVIGLDKIIDA